MLTGGGKGSGSIEVQLEDDAKWVRVGSGGGVFGVVYVPGFRVLGISAYIRFKVTFRKCGYVLTMSSC